MLSVMTSGVLAGALHAQDEEDLVAEQTRQPQEGETHQIPGPLDGSPALEPQSRSHEDAMIQQRCNGDEQESTVTGWPSREDAQQQGRTLVVTG